MAADDLVMQGARSSTAMILTQLNHDNSVPAHSGFNFDPVPVKQPWRICVNKFHNFYQRPVLASGYCHRLCLCVYQSLACPYDNLSPVQARITKFGSEKQNTLVNFPIVFGSGWPWPSRSNLKLQTRNWPHFEFVQPITHHLFKLGFPNLVHKCILALLRSL